LFLLDGSKQVMLLISPAPYFRACLAVTTTVSLTRKVWGAEFSRRWILGGGEDEAFERLDLERERSQQPYGVDVEQELERWVAQDTLEGQGLVVVAGRMGNSGCLTLKTREGRRKGGSVDGGSVLVSWYGEVLRAVRGELLRGGGWSQRFLRAVIRVRRHSRWLILSRSLRCAADSSFFDEIVGGRHVTRGRLEGQESCGALKF